MAHCVDHTKCPECAKLGRDRSGNNLALYSDGSEYCFSCGYYRKASGVRAFKKAAPRTDRAIQLPFDSTNELPSFVREWLGQYSLTDLDIQLNSILWSEHWQRMILPILIEGELVAWQGRYFPSEVNTEGRSFDPQSKAKWFSQGNIHEILYLVGNTKTDRVVLTEDIISAICVAKVPTVCAMPVFGSHISTKTILRLKQYYDIIDVWLDYDKAKESMKFSNTIRSIGCSSKSIITPKDPKEYSQEEIKQWLYN